MFKRVTTTLFQQEGLSCSPNHWPCLENLMTVSFKLDDNMGCLTYCELALERDPEHQKAKLYKSKVINKVMTSGIRMITRFLFETGLQ